MFRQPGVEPPRLSLSNRGQAGETCGVRERIGPVITFLTALLKPSDCFDTRVADPELHRAILNLNKSFPRVWLQQTTIASL